MSRNFSKPEAKFKAGDQVVFGASLPNKELLTIKAEPIWNGFTWMYAFEGTDMRCGGEYLRNTRDAALIWWNNLAGITKDNLTPIYFPNITYQLLTEGEMEEIFLKECFRQDPPAAGAKIGTGTIVEDTMAFYPEDHKPQYIKQENGKWKQRSVDWIEYTIYDNQIGEGKRFVVMTEENKDGNLTCPRCEKTFESNYEYMLHNTTGKCIVPNNESNSKEPAEIIYKTLQVLLEDCISSDGTIQMPSNEVVKNAVSVFHRYDKVIYDYSELRRNNKELIEVCKGLMNQMNSLKMNQPSFNLGWSNERINMWSAALLSGKTAIEKTKQ